MKLNRLLCASSLLAGAVFAIATVPIANFQAQAFEVQPQNKSLLSTNVQDFAVPYLVGVGFVSLGTGFTVLTLGGWRQTSRQLSESQSMIDQLKQENTEKNAALEKLKFSEKNLRKLGLDMFLDEKEVLASSQSDNQQYLHESDASSFQASIAEVAGSKTKTPAIDEKFRVINHLLNANAPLESRVNTVDTSQMPLQLERLLQELKCVTAQLEESTSNRVDSLV